MMNTEDLNQGFRSPISWIAAPRVRNENTNERSDGTRRFHPVKERKEFPLTLPRINSPT